MAPGVIAVGVLAQVVAWSLVASGRANVWTTVGPVLAVAGAAVALVAAPPLSGRVEVWIAAAAGVVAGLALYAATRAFVAVVGRWWPTFTRHAKAVYGQGEAGLGPIAAAAAGAVAVGEELFWRGLTQRELTARFGAAAAAAVATAAAYVLANAASRNLAIVVGALVGGAVWGGLAWWTAGVLASILAHGTWTALMLLRPAVGPA